MTFDTITMALITPQYYLLLKAVILTQKWTVRGLLLHLSENVLLYKVGKLEPEPVFMLVVAGVAWNVLDGVAEIVFNSASQTEMWWWNNHSYFIREQWQFERAIRYVSTTAPLEDCGLVILWKEELESQFTFLQILKSCPLNFRILIY